MISSQGWFLVWASWGHIPLHNAGEHMLSHNLYSNVKTKTSFGCATSTWSTMKKAMVAVSAAPPVDNRCGNKRNVDTMQDNDGKDVALLTKTIELISAESVENEEEQRRHMFVCLACNKLAPHKHAARYQRSQLHLQQLYWNEFIRTSGSVKNSDSGWADWSSSIQVLKMERGTITT